MIDALIVTGIVAACLICFAAGYLAGASGWPFLARWED